MPSDAFMAVEFAQSKGQARQEGRTGVKFADAAGMDQTLKDLQEIVEVMYQADDLACRISYSSCCCTPADSSQSAVISPTSVSMHENMLHGC